MNSKSLNDKNKSKFYYGCANIKILFNFFPLILDGSFIRDKMNNEIIFERLHIYPLKNMYN